MASKKLAARQQSVAEVDGATVVVLQGCSFPGRLGDRQAVPRDVRGTDRASYRGHEDAAVINAGGRGLSHSTPVPREAEGRGRGGTPDARLDSPLRLNP